MMNQEDIFNKIGQILNELNDQYQYLSQNKQELNELELELFLANASFLAEHVQIIRKLNKKTEQKTLPEPATHQEEKIELLPVIPVKMVEEQSANTANLEEDIFKLDKEPSTFEFILNEKPSGDKFEFEEKPVDEIFDRPLSKEETYIIAQKQKLRELDSLESQLPEEDEIGPEPFLVAETEEELAAEASALQPAANLQPENSITASPGQSSAITDIPYTASAAESISAPHPAATASADLPVSAAAQEGWKDPKADHIKAFYTAAPTSADAASSGTPEELPKSKPTLNDILSGGTNQHPVNPGNNRTEIADLKQAISLNDKMRYIKDLFNGYNLAYAEAIDLLNKMPDFKTADHFLQQNYALKNNWAAKEETATQFYELLNQRFPVK